VFLQKKYYLYDRKNKFAEKLESKKAGFSIKNRFSVILLRAK